MQDDVCVGGLVVVLSNDDISVVQTALEVFLNFTYVLMHLTHLCERCILRDHAVM